MVIARVPDPWRMLAARRHYIPANVPLVKHVAAAAGDEVCALGQEVFINGRLVAERRAVDAGDRPMPSWSGCVRQTGRASCRERGCQYVEVSVGAVSLKK